MKVNLFSVTVADINGKTLLPEDIIVYSARVSNPDNQGKSPEKLLRYLMEHEHWSPFDMADIGVEVFTSRAIAAQILRHWSFDFQEFSQRYMQVGVLEEKLDQSFFEPVQLRRRDIKNRQNSLDDLDADLKAGFEKEIEVKFLELRDLYERMVQAEVATEVARMVLPLATTTRLYMTGSVRSWIHYVRVRTHPGTQKEHRDVACAVREILATVLPNIAVIENWPVNPMVTEA